MIDFVRRLFSIKHKEFYTQCKLVALFVVSYHLPPIEEITKILLYQEELPKRIKPFTNEILLPPHILKDITKAREIQRKKPKIKYEEKYLERICELAIKIKKYYNRQAYRAIFEELYQKKVEENWRNGKFHFGMLGNLYAK